MGPTEKGIISENKVHLNLNLVKYTINEIFRQHRLTLRVKIDSEKSSFALLKCMAVSIYKRMLSALSFSIDRITLILIPQARISQPN